MSWSAVTTCASNRPGPEVWEATTGTCIWQREKLGDSKGWTETVFVTANTEAASRQQTQLSLLNIT